MQLKGKLIWSSAEAKLKTMRAAALTLSLAFSWGSSKAESLENSEGDTCTYVQQALSRQPRKGAQKSVRGFHAFLLLTAVPRQGSGKVRLHLPADGRGPKPGQRNGERPRSVDGLATGPDIGGWGARDVGGGGASPAPVGDVEGCRTRRPCRRRRLDAAPRRWQPAPTTRG
jgi:hypothetical protein